MMYLSIICFNFSHSMYIFHPGVHVIFQYLPTYSLQFFIIFSSIIPVKETENLQYIFSLLIRYFLNICHCEKISQCHLLIHCSISPWFSSFHNDIFKISILFWECHNRGYTRLLWLWARGSFLTSSENHMGYWKSNPCRLHARQAVALSFIKDH